MLLRWKREKPGSASAYDDPWAGGWEADDGHFLPRDPVGAFDLKLSLDGGALTVCTKIAFLKLGRIGSRCDKDLNVRSGLFACSRLRRNLPVGVVRRRYGRWRLASHDTDRSMSVSWNTEEVCATRDRLGGAFVFVMPCCIVDCGVAIPDPCGLKLRQERLEG